MSAVHLPSYFKSREFAAVRMRLSLAFWLVLGIFCILVIAPRLLGMG